MCQIISMKSLGSAKLLADLTEHKEEFKSLLLLKGEDYFSAGILAKNKSTQKLNQKPIQLSIITHKVEDLFSSLTKILNGDSFIDCTSVGLILFSRQKPEMERDKPETQPYFIDEGIIAIHGTIINDKELAEERDLTITIDTEIFKTYAIGDDRVNGTFACIQITNDINIVVRDNGLKLWRANINDSSTSVISTGNLDFLSKDPTEILTFPIRENQDRILFTAFSGGMDIALSTYKALSTGIYQSAQLNYFDWGSNASKEEIKTLHTFAKFYSLEFNLPVSINIIQAEDYFAAFFNIAEVRSKISDSKAIGDIAETESPIAYVPYRNTQFAMLLSTIAEGKNYKNIDILFGLNLSEGMVFMDNSEGWLNAIQETIRYGGKDFKITGGYNIIAPYFPRTKTNMIKEFKEEFGQMALNNLLDKSYSCYYPKEDGSPCGECGSCILRKQALQKK